MIPEDEHPRLEGVQHATGEALCMLNHFQLFVTLWIVGCQTPLSMGFFRQEYWSGLPFPSPGYLSNPWIKPASPVASALAGRFFTTEPPGKPKWLGLPTENQNHQPLLSVGT